MMIGVVIGATTAGAFTRIDRFNSQVVSTIRQQSSQEGQLFDVVLERVKRAYVTEPDGAKLVDSALNGMLSSLDPHSSYMGPKAWSAMQTESKGEFGGLGVEITLDNGAVKVVAPVDGTPAHRAGILANDRITRIQGEQVMGLSLNQAVDLMRGQVGSEVEITVQRNDDKPKDIKLVRETIRVQTVRSRAIDDVAYVRVAQFNEQATTAMRAAISKLKAEIGPDRVKGYVLDLRNNPGGILEQAVSVAGTFAKGEIVSMKGRGPKDVHRFSSDTEDLTDGKPVVVLINGGSASASEIVAGALQDLRRAVVVGTRSFGKGSVQTVTPIAAGRENAGALRLTTALYYTPDGRSIQARGITPDREIAIADVPEEFRDRTAFAGEVGLKGHIHNKEGDRKDVSSAYVPSDPGKDTQLAAAVDMIRSGQATPAGR